MTEEFRIIPDTEGMYSVSNLGRVRNNSTMFILKPFLTPRGYLQVCIGFTSRKDRITVNVHKLVIRAFVPSVDGKPYANHIDGDKTNNKATNLEWCTPSENNQHAVAIGLVSSGEDSYLHVLTEPEVISIINELRLGARNIDLAKRYNVSPPTIDDIRCNRTWRFIEREPIASNGPVRKLTGEDIPVIRKLFDTLRDCDIAPKFGVATATINQIRRGKTWKNY